MKKILLSFLFTAGAFAAAHAQGNFVSEKAANNDSALVTGATVGDVKVYNRIKAVSGTVKIKWNATSYSQGSTAGTLANGWRLIGICDNEGCRDATFVMNGASFTSNDYTATTSYTNDFNDFHAQFNADNAAANSIAWIRASVADASNPSSARTFTFVAAKSPAGVTSVTRYDDNIVVYPNPATSEVNVIFDKSSKIRSIAVYNLIGQATDMYRVSGNSAKLQLTDAPAGVYFLRMLDDRGNVVATRRFNRQ